MVHLLPGAASTKQKAVTGVSGFRISKKKQPKILNCWQKKVGLGLKMV